MTVVNGSPVDPDLLNQLELEHCDVFISATMREETSILAALYAKKYGVPRIFVKVNTHDTKAILEQLEMTPIDTDDAAAHNVVLEVAEPLIANLVGIGKGQFDVREKKVSDFPNLWGKRLGDIEGKFFNVIALFQEEKFQLSGDTILNEDDSMIIIEEAGRDEDVNKNLKKIK
jgi:trk system potassium uptake protein TrkA